MDPKTLQEEDAIVYKDFIEFLKRNLETNPNCKRLEPNIELKTSTDCCCLNDQLDKNPVSASDIALRLFISSLQVESSFYGHEITNSSIENV